MPNYNSIQVGPLASFACDLLIATHIAMILGRPSRRRHSPSMCSVHRPQSLRPKRIHLICLATVGSPGLARLCASLISLRMQTYQSTVALVGMIAPGQNPPAHYNATYDSESTILRFRGRDKLSLSTALSSINPLRLRNNAINHS